MSKLRKRSLLICIALALALTGMAAMLAFAAETVPMPENKGIARMRKDIYQMYADGIITKDDFDTYAKSFEINEKISLTHSADQFIHSVAISKEKGSKGVSKTTVEFSAFGTMDVQLSSVEAYNEEMVNNFDMRQKLFLYTHPVGNMRYHTMGFGYNYTAKDLYSTASPVYDYVDMILSGEELYKGGVYNSKYTWQICTRGYATATQWSYQLLDKANAGVGGWTVELDESGDHTADGKTIYQLIVRDKNGDQFRPANKQITYEDLATLQLLVSMKSTDTKNGGKTYEIPAKAVAIREKVTSDQGYPSAIVFEFYGDEWLNLEDQVVITGVKAVRVLPEGAQAPSYDVWDMYADIDLTDTFGVTSDTPVTDFAGNGIEWEGTSIAQKGDMTMDRKEAVIVGVELSFSNCASPEGTTVADYTQSFSGPNDFITYPALVMNEEMHFDRETMKDVQIQLNLRDKDGNPVRSNLRTIYTYTDRSGIPYSVLSFESISFAAGMTPQGERIVVEQVINEHLLQDRVGNINLQNDILMTENGDPTLLPTQTSFLDTKSPTVTVQDAIVRQKTTTDGKTESIQITVPFRITDFDPGEGLRRSTASGTTASLCLSNPIDGQAIEYRYAVTYTTDFPAADAAGVDWYTGNLGKTGHSNYATFGVGEENTNMYLHMELSNLTGYEISEQDGLEIRLNVQDMAQNRTQVDRNIPITGVDNVAPEVELYNRAITVSKDSTAVSFQADIQVEDTNGISLVEYRFVDSEDDTATVYSVLYQHSDGADYALKRNEKAAETFEATDLVEKILQVRSYDKNNNSRVVSMSFSADLNKVITSYELTGDIFQPSAQTGIHISKPVYNGTLSDEAATRVTVVVPAEDGEDIYFRVIPVTEMNGGPVQALDPEAVWYQAGEWDYHVQNQYYIYHDVTQVEGVPGWVGHYGQMDVYVASANRNLLSWSLDDEGNPSGTLILNPDYANADGVASTYSWSKLGTVAHASDADNAYSMSYGTGSGRVVLTDSTGEEVAAAIVYDPDDSSRELYRYARFSQTIAGVRVSISLENEKMPEWGKAGIDFENSYAVLVRADENGTIIENEDGSYEEVTARLPLSNSPEQVLSVPNIDGFTSGVYTWVVHIAQQGGGVSDFAEGRVLMLLDNADVPENFGVLEHTTRIQAAQGREGYGQFIDNERKAAQGETLKVINIGVAKPSEMWVRQENEDRYTFSYEQNLETIALDGYASYFKGVTNSANLREGSSPTHTGSFTLTADTTDSGYGTYLGQEVGKVQGIRFWNKASSGDHRQLSYVKTDQPYSNQGVEATLTAEGAVAKLEVFFNVNWYSGVSSDIYTPEELSQRTLGQFGVMKGTNTICYQLLLENGKESPVYSFTLNLVEEAPAVEVEIDFGPYYSVDHYEDTDNNISNGLEQVYYRNTEYMDIYFRNMFSSYSGLKVYHAQFVGKSDYGSAHYEFTELTDEQLENGYRIYEASSCMDYSKDYAVHRYGFAGTYITSNNSPTGSESFFVITDDSGNAITVYPIDNWELGQRFEAFAPVDADYIYYAEDEGYYPEYVGFHSMDLVTFDNSTADIDRNTFVDFILDAPAGASGEELEELWVSYDVQGRSNSIPNGSGLGYVDSTAIYFAVPYDPNVEEGTLISHTATIRARGERDKNGIPNYTNQFTVEFEAPNVKPAIKAVNAKAGALEIVYTVPVVTDRGAAVMEYLPESEGFAYGESYAHTYMDLFGNTYTETFTVPEKAADPVVTYSSTEYTDTPVTVTVTSAENSLTVRSDVDVEDLTPDYEKYYYGYGLYIDERYNAYWDFDYELYCTFDVVTDEWGDEYPENFRYFLDPEYKIEVIGNWTGELQLIAEKNFQADVYFGDGSYAACIEVMNHVKTDAVDPYISWDYDAGDVADGVVYGNVTAYLVDRNGQALLDPATGNPARFTFYPGGPTEYTFTGCYSHATNTPVPDTTAVLEVTLKNEPVAEKDTLAPDVDMVAYLKPAEAAAKAANVVYRKSSGRFLMTDYAFRYGLTEEEVYYEDVNEMIAQMGWSDAYMFHLDIHDESMVRIILKESIYETGVTYNSASDAIDGVSLVGRTLQVSRNCEFALYMVDEEDNITALHISITNLSAAPVPTLALAESRTAEGEPAIRVYLLPPQISDYENLKITNVGAQTDNEEYTGTRSDYFGLDYMLYALSGTYDIGYSYQVPGMGTYEGTLEALVEVPVLTRPAVVHQVWSANYFNAATNQDISLHLDLNTPVKAAAVVYTVGENDNRVAERVLQEAGLYVSAFRENVSIIYEANTEKLLADLAAQFGDGTLRLMLTEMEYGTIGYFDLPEVRNIDTDGPALVGEAVIEVDPEHYKSAVITLNLDEIALSGDGRQKGTQFQYTVRENETYTYTFMDEAGNRSSFDVEVNSLITDPLKITLSTSASDAGIIADPASYQAQVGQILYAKTNRDATISVYGKDNQETATTAAKDTWTAITVTENSMGMHPSVVARDNYGNLAIVQLEYIPIRDITAPAAFLHRDTVSVAATATEDEIESELLDNIFCSDDTTKADDLVITVDYARITSGKTVATYTVTDEEGNTTTRQCWLRIRSGLEPVIRVNGLLVEDGAFLYVKDRRDLEITVSFDGAVAEPYKLVYESGDLRSWAKLKDGTWLTAGYDDPISQTYQVAELGEGWYSFALTTQGMEVYYFQVHIG